MITGIYIYRERERPLLNWKRRMEEFLKMTADIIYTYIYIYILSKVYYTQLNAHTF